MAKIHTLTYNGTKSSDLGVFVTGSGSFDAAEFDVDKYEIPGRNGDLILSNNRYKNIEITYPAFIPKAFMDKVQNVRNWLRSSRVYARLEDTYDMDHYRLGIPTGVQSFSPENRNDGANFEMTFDCKPQRFLKVGETPETVEADVQMESGEIVTFETVAESPITSASVTLSPIQSLNGYDSPWPGGGGLNKLPTPTAQSKTSNGITISVSDGVYRISGTATATAEIIFDLPFDVTIPPSCSCAFLNDAVNAGVVVYWRYNYTNGASMGFGGSTNKTANYTNTFTLNKLRFLISSGTVISGTLTTSPVIYLTTETTPTSFSPYSNICPISGHTGAELNRTGINIWDEVAEVGGIDNSTGQNSAGGTNRMRSKNYIPCVPNTQYCLYDGSGVNLFAYWYDADKNYIGLGSVAGLNANNYKLDTSPSNARYMRFRTENNYGTTYNNDISINYPATDTEYHAYDGDTYSVTFTDQGTVYGGIYDFVTGKLKVTHKTITVDGTQTITWNSGAGVVQIIGTEFAETDDITQFYSDRFMAHTMSGVADMNNEFAVNSAGILMIKAPALFTSLGEASTYFVNNPTQFVGLMSAPIEYTLSPQQLTTLLGQNVVWGSGPITLTYAEPYNIENPTIFDARPLFTVTNPADGDVITVNGQAITFVDGYTGTVFIDCETMNAYSGAANLNSIIEATDFPVLVPGTNIVTWTGTGECTMTPRWWEL